MIIRNVFLAALAAFSFTAAGCGGGAGKVEGLVTLDGAPVDGATVTFNPVGEGRPGSAVTNAQGIFKIEGKEGLAPGKYKVTVTKREQMMANLSPEAQKDPTLAMKEMIKAGKITGDPTKKVLPKPGTGPAIPPNLMPAIYGDSNKTPFEIEIPHSGQVKLEMQKKK